MVDNQICISCMMIFQILKFTTIVLLFLFTSIIYIYCNKIIIFIDQDDYGVWKYVEQELKAHLPLRNVTWKTKTGTTKVVDKINLDVVPYL